MISAWWLLPALFIGAAGGYIAAAMCFAGREDEPDR